MRVLDTQFAKSFQGNISRNHFTRRQVEGVLGWELLRLTNQKQTRDRSCGPKDSQRHLTNVAPPCRTSLTAPIPTHARIVPTWLVASRPPLSGWLSLVYAGFGVSFHFALTRKSEGLLHGLSENPSLFPNGVGTMRGRGYSLSKAQALARVASTERQRFELRRG